MLYGMDVVEVVVGVLIVVYGLMLVYMLDIKRDEK